METSITVTPILDDIPMGKKYTVSISDWDMEKAYFDLFSEQERKSFDNLMNGTLAQTMLALTMVVYALEQDKAQTENKPSVLASLTDPRGYKEIEE